MSVAAREVLEELLAMVEQTLDVSIMRGLPPVRPEIIINVDLTNLSKWRTPIFLLDAECDAGGSVSLKLKPPEGKVWIVHEAFIYYNNANDANGNADILICARDGTGNRVASLFDKDDIADNAAHQFQLGHPAPSADAPANTSYVDGKIYLNGLDGAYLEALAGNTQDGDLFRAYFCYEELTAWST